MPTQESTLRVGVDSKPMIDGARKGERALEKLGKKGEDLGATFDKINKRTTLLTNVFRGLVAVGVGKFFLDATRAAGTFETKMAEVSTLVDTAVFDLNRLEDAILSQSRAFGQSPVQQAAAAYQIISAGAGTATEAISLLDASNRLAIGGVTDVATAADGLTSVLNAYGMEASNASDVSDVLFVGMRAGKTTIGELAGSLGNVAPLAAQAGVSFDELVASIAALTKGGIATRQAVTGVRAILAAVTKPTQEASDMAKRLGIDFNAAALQSKGFAGFMDEVVRATGGSSDAMAQLFGGVEALVPALALAGQAGVDMNKILDDMKERGGATQEAFDKMTNTFEFQGNRLRQSLISVMIQLGSVITSVLTPAIKFLADNFDALSRFVVIAAAGFSALLIPSLFAMIPAIASVTAGLLAMAAAWLLTPFGQIAALIIGVSAALAYFGDTNVEVAGRVATVWQVFQAVLLTAGQYFKQLFDIAVAVWQGIINGLGELAGKAGEIFTRILDWAVSTWTGAETTAGEFFTSIKNKLTEFLSNWGISLDTVVGWIKAGVNTYIGLYVGFLSAIKPIITEGIPALFQLAMAKAKNLAITGLQNIINVFVRGLGGLGDALDLIPGFDGIGDSIRQSLTVDFSDLKADTADLQANLEEAGSRISSTFGEALERDYVGSFGETLSMIGTKLSDDLGSNLDGVTKKLDTTDQVQTKLNTTLDSGAAKITALGDASKESSDKLDELKRKQEQYIEGLDSEYERIQANNGGAREQVRAWYQEQLITLDKLGLKYEDFSSRIETIFDDRMSKAREKDLANAEDWASGVKRALNSIEKESMSAADMAESTLTGAFDKASDALADFVLTGKFDFKEFARSIISDIVRMIAKQLILNAVRDAFGGFANGGLVVNGGQIPAFAEGGRIHGPGTGTSDSILVKVSNGEYIVNAKATSDYLPLLQRINAGQMPAFSDGGMVSKTTDNRVNSGLSLKDYDTSKNIIGIGSKTEVNIYNSTSGEVRTSERTGSDGTKIIDVIVERAKAEISEEISRGGTDVNRSIEARYGLNSAQGI